MRVDAAGYTGYSPPPQFDPLLAKVIGSSPTPDLAAAVDRTRRAVESFHIAGLPTNRAQLLAILDHPAVRAGDARTTLLSEAPELSTAEAPGAPVAALDAGGGAAEADAARQRAGLPVGPGQEAVRSPMGGTVIEVRAATGDAVRSGDGLLLISAMKMETLVTAPCAGIIAGMLDVRPGDTVAQDTVVALVAPAAAGMGGVEVAGE